MSFEETVEVSEWVDKNLSGSRRENAQNQIEKLIGIDTCKASDIMFKRSASGNTDYCESTKLLPKIWEKVMFVVSLEHYWGLRPNFAEKMKATTDWEDHLVTNKTVEQKFCYSFHDTNIEVKFMPENGYPKSSGQLSIIIKQFYFIQNLSWDKVGRDKLIDLLNMFSMLSRGDCTIIETPTSKSNYYHSNGFLEFINNALLPNNYIWGLSGQCFVAGTERDFNYCV